MTAPAIIPGHDLLPDPAVFDRPRDDGWTAAKQRAFLEALANGYSVPIACTMVGMSKTSAYTLRRSARGATFALGWEAAVLRAREPLADELMDRAMNGRCVTTWNEAGEPKDEYVFSDHLAFKMLTRLDRMAESASAAASNAAARLAATDFEAFMTLVERDAGPARAGLFLAARLAPAAEPASEDDLAPIRALARADRWLRTHTDLAEPIAVDDLDPAARGDWTAEQWARAEAAGLLRLAEPPTPAPDPRETSQLSADKDAPETEADDERVWWDEIDERWHTDFPPPEGFTGWEVGTFGDDHYARALTPQEKLAWEAPWLEEVAQEMVRDGAARDRFFGFTPAPAEDEDDAPQDAMRGAR